AHNYQSQSRLPIYRGLTMTPVPKLIDNLKDNIAKYLDSSVPLKSAELASERIQLLKEDGATTQKPLLELLHKYASSKYSFRDLEQKIQVSGFEEFVQLGLFKGIAKPYAHQEKALFAALDGNFPIVTSGTGSGKTESFLLPIIARLLKESENW